MVDFVCSEYTDGKLVADKRTIESIIETGIRKTARATNLDTKTIMTIVRQGAVRTNTLAKVLKFVGTLAKENPD